jgi:transcriptional regulator with XRE-family HTH domain
MDTTSLTASLSKATIAPTELARRAGVSRNTEWSLRRDPSRAKLGTLRELALACGLDIRIATVEASDPYAAAAARVMVGDLLAENVENQEQLTQWVARLRRWAPDAEPLQLTKMAAEVSAPQSRAGAIFLIGRHDPDRLASAAIASEQPWSLSGAPALDALGIEPISSASPTVLWTLAPAIVMGMLLSTHRKTTVASGANVIVAPLHQTVLAGGANLGGLELVSPVQAVIDSLGVGGELGVAAHNIAGRW